MRIFAWCIFIACVLSDLWALLKVLAILDGEVWSIKELFNVLLITATIIFTGKYIWGTF